MASLAELFGKQLSPQLGDLYWRACSDLAIEQFERAAMSSMRNAKHFPRPADLRECLKSSEIARPNINTFAGLPPRDSKWLLAVNRLFLGYLAKRRLEEKFSGDINLKARRSACLALVKFFEGLEAEADPEATEAELAKRFDAAMARVADRVAAAA